MKAATLVPVEEYLRNTYDPDRDYVDGELVERNVGELEHSDLQTEIARYFRNKRREWKTYAFVEQRVQVAPRRFRVPDVCIVIGSKPTTSILTAPPFICVEVLSPEDRQLRVQDRITDYLNFGVPYVWVVDPHSRRAWVHTRDRIEEAKDGILRTENPAMALDLGEIFREMDED